MTIRFSPTTQGLVSVGDDACQHADAPDFMMTERINGPIVTRADVTTTTYSQKVLMAAMATYLRSSECSPGYDDAACRARHNHSISGNASTANDLRHQFTKIRITSSHATPTRPASALRSHHVFDQQRQRQPPSQSARHRRSHPVAHAHRVDRYCPT